MSGRIGDLSPQQEEALKQLKEAVADVHRNDYDDNYYLRWLRARNFSVKKAESMMRKNLAWRKMVGADTILEDYKPPEIIDKYYPRALLGKDHEGSPVRLFPFKKLDLRGFAFSISRTDVVKFIVYIFEEDIRAMEEESRKSGRVVESYTCILDLDGYTFTQATNKHAVDMLNEILKMNEANYPERLKIAYFVNVPSYFWLALALSRPFLSDATVSKFKVFGRTGYQEELRSIMDPDILPVTLGGNRTDPDGDPMCRSVVHYGDFIPKSLYFQKEERNFAEEEGVKTLSIGKRSFESVEINVEEAGTRLEWEVSTADNDLGIGLYYSPGPLVDQNNGNMEEVLPVQKYNCHLIPESCAYMCEKAGVYVLKFDNRYSWFTSKKVHYRLTVTLPEEEEEEVTRF